MTLDQAIRDARRRASKTGLTWHVIDVWDELSGPTHETVSEHHPKAKEAIFTAKGQDSGIASPGWWKRLGQWMATMFRKFLP